MHLIKKYKEILIYGISIALLLLLLKWFEAHFIVFNYRLDLFIGVIAILFTLLGIWLALKLVKPKPGDYRVETFILPVGIIITLISSLILKKKVPVTTQL